MLNHLLNVRYEVSVKEAVIKSGQSYLAELRDQTLVQKKFRHMFGRDFFSFLETEKIEYR